MAVSVALSYEHELSSSLGLTVYNTEDVSLILDSSGLIIQNTSVASQRVRVVLQDIKQAMRYDFSKIQIKTTGKTYRFDFDNTVNGWDSLSEDEIVQFDGMMNMWLDRFRALGVEAKEFDDMFISSFFGRRCMRLS